MRSTFIAREGEDGGKDADTVDITPREACRILRGGEHVRRRSSCWVFHPENNGNDNDGTHLQEHGGVIDPSLVIDA